MLTHRELKEIQEGNRRNADVMDLLREIKRLRQHCIESYLFIGRWSINDISEENQARLHRLRAVMGAEPCVIEYGRMAQKKEQMEARRRAATNDVQPPRDHERD